MSRIKNIFILLSSDKIHTRTSNEFIPAHKQKQPLKQHARIIGSITATSGFKWSFDSNCYQSYGADLSYDVFMPTVDKYYESLKTGKPLEGIRDNDGQQIVVAEIKIIQHIIPVVWC